MIPLMTSDKVFPATKKDPLFWEQTDEPLTKSPEDCTECINDKHPDRCRKYCKVLAKNQLKIG